MCSGHHPGILWACSKVATAHHEDSKLKLPKLFLSHKLYGQRPARHIYAYRQEPGWWFLEVGSWTLEVDLG